jgi:hypothetical protein
LAEWIEILTYEQEFAFSCVVQSALYKLFSGDLGGFLNLSRDIDKAAKSSTCKAQQDL